MSLPATRVRPLPAARPVRAQARPAPVLPEGLRDVPGATAAWGWVWRAITTGKASLPGHMPAYVGPDPREKAQAIARGAGRTVAQPFNSDNAAATELNDAVNLVVRGSKEQLLAAFASQGWGVAAPRTPWPYIKTGLSVLTRLWNEKFGPVTKLYLNGKPEDFTLIKNCDFNWGRDHFRVYHQGKDPATGEDIWAICAIRDTALSLELHWPKHVGPHLWNWKFQWPSFGHDVDHDIDPERDLVMHDLLASGQVADWALVNGQRPASVQTTPRADGRYQIDRLISDGRVYDVRLK